MRSTDLMLIHTSLIIETMSGNTLSLVPILDGTNYGVWSSAMKAYLMSQGLWPHAAGTAVRPDEAAPKAEPHIVAAANARIADFDKEETQCVGHLVLRCVPSIQQDISHLDDPETIWNRLFTLYGAATLTTIYKDFREVTTINLNPAQHPGPQLDKCHAAFSRLAASSMPVLDCIQALIVLNRLPQKWETLASIITQNFDVNNLTFREVRDAILAQWESEQTRGGKPRHKQANKLSSVKRKRGDPNFSNQQKGNQQKNNDGNSNSDDKHKRGKRGGKGKKKEGDHQHSHIASVASTSLPTSSTIAHLGPSGLAKRVEHQAPPLQRTEGPYPSLNNALSLADRLGVKPTIQTVKNLEERVTEVYTSGALALTQFVESDEEDVDMSYTPEDPQMAQEVSFDDEETFSLDWGSDLEDIEECVPLSSPLPVIHNLTASHQPLKRPGLLKRTDGYFELATPLDKLSGLKCEHGFHYAECTKCKGLMGKMGPLWLLDSGASAHFTNNFDDFIEYTPANPSERTPVRTASTTIYVEGQGTVLLKHYHGTTRIHPVLYIPKLTTRLLSLGEFLQQGLSVSGDAWRISIQKRYQVVLQCAPLVQGQTVYWLDASVSDVDTSKAHNIYSVDYDLMHKRLGHPSKDVLTHAKNKTKGFPKDLIIPTKPHVCPGCAQGKMPATSHPPSETRASAPFERIHSDLKSFPIRSYHKYQYFISFFDDYTSYAWIVLLRKKSAAINALKQFLAMVKNQYNATVKEWLSDAGGEYKSDAFLEHLKDQGIKILQSAPYTPQQNGHAEHFMRTVMDKAEAMRLEACIPDSWWEFSVLHATHVYNCTPLRRHNWRTPYETLNGDIPDIAHLRIFGCGAYVHIPKKIRNNALSPKSELMIYLGHTEGIKAFTFMRTKNNTVFTSATALFDEDVYPKCPKSRMRGTTRVDEPLIDQPPHDPYEDTTSDGEDDSIQPSSIKKEAPAPELERVPEEPPEESVDEPSECAPSPPPPAPQPRRSQRNKRVPTHPGNVYGESRHPANIERDVRRTRTWKQMTESGPSRPGESSTSEPIPQGKSSPDAQSENSPEPDEDEVEDLLRLQREGGVKYLDYLLAKAVPPMDPVSPDTAKIREWTFRDILKMPSASQKEWKQACREELDSLRRRKVFELTDPPKNRKIIKNRWVFDLQSDGRKKARLVAKGFSQVEGIDYDEIFSPVVRFETVRLMMALAALNNWHITGLDVKTAFLYGELDEELYMEQPEGFKIKGQETKVMRLKRAIYGLKQAALAWWRALDKSMSTLGCTRLLSDSGLFINKEKTIIAIVYVDDLLFLGADKDALLRLKKRFMNIWECRDLGDTQEFLRMRIRREGSKIRLDQTDYLNKVVSHFELNNAKSVPTPLPEGYHPSANTSSPDPALRSKFQQVIGSLLYIMLGTHPDIAFAVTKLSQFAANPTEDHLNRAYYICRYLLGTADYALVYDGSTDGGLCAFADSDWASDPITRKSTTGYLVKLSGAIFSWNSRAQKTIALSSTEAEYMSLSDTSKQLIWFKSLLTELGIEIGPIPLYGDNQGSIFLASNPVQEKRIKHIDLRYHFIREVVRNKQVELFFIEGAENPADLFTKNLGRIKFIKFREQLGLEFYNSST